MTSTAAPRMRSVLWKDDGLQIIDQRKLPSALVLQRCESVEQVKVAIRDMAVRGAPAIGAAGAFGLAIAANAFPRDVDTTYVVSPAMGDWHRTRASHGFALIGCVQRGAVSAGDRSCQGGH
ncbi:hypothetical protein PINS_up018797 [Pythium insidiosum]|nr:hypothetical protein PINS_up016761 [Pythium insidiosum]GLE07968.1 hypothetical protein PINS_up018797 [Pythium insidiosum]